MTRRADIAAQLPYRLGLRQAEAAAFVGVSTTKYVEMERRGLMPPPRDLGGIPIYDAEEIAAAFRALPHYGERTLDTQWKDVAA